MGNGYPKMWDLAEAESHKEAGGKARGLARLLAAGLAVPPGIVAVLDPADPLPRALAERCASLGGPWAVRSSADQEDGAELSFAGQFESVLGVRDQEGLRDALARCLGATSAAAAYRAGTGVAAQGGIALIVQRMVAARCAGVLFTVDPVTGAADRLVIEAVSGTGERLTAGLAHAERYVLSREGEVLDVPAAQGRLLGEGDLAAIWDGARRATAAFGGALDLEWALAHDGGLLWLQARPVTAQGAGEMLESPPPDPSWVLTTYNIREIMPGAITPLSRQAMGSGIDDGMREIFMRAGVPEKRLRDVPVVRCYAGHLFLNLTALYALGEYVLIASKEHVDYSIAGRLIPGEVRPPAPLLIRAANVLRYAKALWEVPARFERFAGRCVPPRFGEVNGPEEARAAHQQLGQGWDLTSESFRAHLATSTAAGALYGFLIGVLSNGRQPALPEDHARASVLLRGLEGEGQSSLMLRRRMEELAALLRQYGGGLAGMSDDEALAWLRGPAPEAVREAFARFLSDHGHRGVRECDLYELDWSEDPRLLVGSLMALLEAPPPRQDSEEEAERVMASLPLPARLMVRKLLPAVRRAIVRRERSKSLAVQTMRSLKPGYLALAAYLRAQGRLPDVGLVHFLSHEEIGRLLEGSDPALLRTARVRRSAHSFQSRLRFPDVCQGLPQPLPEEQAEAREGEELRGTPVSNGVARGPARVARTLDEARALRQGEVLVVPHTDVGWVPLFARAAGLATEIGGTLSHGAVVAREFGLPAVVDLTGVMSWLRTGDEVVLDGGTGVLRRVHRGGAQPEDGSP